MLENIVSIFFTLIHSQKLTILIRFISISLTFYFFYFLYKYQISKFKLLANQNKSFIDNFYNNEIIFLLLSLSFISFCYLVKMIKQSAKNSLNSSFIRSVKHPNKKTQ